MKLFFLKIVNLYVFCAGFVLYLFKVKRGDLPNPPSGIIDIGFIDKDLQIHTPDQFKSLFREENLYLDGDYICYKVKTIRLVLVDGKVLIRKAYMGSIKEKVKFYNEVKCLRRMNHLRNTPAIQYLDYTNLTAYISYIDGICLRKVTETEKKFDNSTITKLLDLCKDTLGKIHENRVAVIDVWSHNMIYVPEEQEVHFIDFADSICSTVVPDGYLRFLQKLDNQKLSKNVLDRLQ